MPGAKLRVATAAKKMNVQRLCFSLFWAYYCTQFQFDCNPSQVKSNLRLNLFKCLTSQSILNRFCSNFGFYISGPILTKYLIPHQISTNPTSSNIKISTNLNYFKCFYLSQFKINLGQTLDSIYHDQSQ